MSLLLNKTNVECRKNAQPVPSSCPQVHCSSAELQPAFGHEPLPRPPWAPSRVPGLGSSWSCDYFRPETAEISFHAAPVGW